MSWRYEREDKMEGAYINVEGSVECDEGLRSEMAGGKSLATMNELYKNTASGWNHVVNFLYINLYEYLTARHYVMVTFIAALWMQGKAT